MADLTLAQFRMRTVMPSATVDELESLAPGWIEQQIASCTAWAYSRLRKRYEVPFADPVPEAFLQWVTVLVTARAYMRIGVDPRDAQFELIKADRDGALAELKEAADSKDGLFDLPLRADTVTTGITQGAPLSYSEGSPYDWTDVQADRVRGHV